jgi:hypothetical protein
MAITTDYPGIKVEVRVAEAVLQEYDDDEAESSTNAATKYIEATSGLTFDIRFEMTPKWPDNPVLFRTYVDGRHVRDRIAKQEDFRGTSYEMLVEGSAYTENERWFITKFAFSALRIGILAEH